MGADRNLSALVLRSGVRQLCNGNLPATNRETFIRRFGCGFWKDVGDNDSPDVFRACPADFLGGERIDVMKHWNSDPQPWYLVPLKPGSERGLRRWDVAIITMLAVLVLGLLLSAVVQPTPGGTAHKVPSKVHHVS
jgi:hypothetical protein